MLIQKECPQCEKIYDVGWNPDEGDPYFCPFCGFHEFEEELPSFIGKLKECQKDMPEEFAEILEKEFFSLIE